MNTVRTHYDNLQVSRNANDSVIRAAYKALAQKYHPDKNLESPRQAEEAMKFINEAFAVLSDPVRKATHDAWIKQEEAETSPIQPKRAATTNERAEGTPSTNETDQDVRGRAHSAEVLRSQNAQTKNETRHREAAKPQVAATPQSSSNANESYFLCAVTLCVVAAWNLTLGSPMGKSLGFSAQSFLELLFNGAFLGLVVAKGIFPFAAICIGWVIGRLLPEGKKIAGGLSLLFGILAFALLEYAQVILQEQQPVAAASAKSPVPAAPPKAIATQQLTNKQKYDQAVKEIEARYPELNSNLPGYRKDLVAWVVQSTNRYSDQGVPEHVAVWRAVNDLVKRSVSPAKTTPPDPVSSVTGSLSSGERMAISMACSDYELNGDIVGYRKCMETQTRLASSTSALPSIADLPSGEQMAINMACSDYELNGDIVGYRSCMRSQLRKIGR